MNGIIEQATAAAILYILDQLPGLHPNRESREAFFTDDSTAFAPAVAEAERN